MWMSPLATVFGQIVRTRDWCYRNHLLTEHRLSKPVISIGNITMGGTGKTPMVDHLLKWGKSRSIRWGVVSRGYGGSYRGVVRVPASGDPAVFGDEPSLLARRHADVPIYLGRRKYRAGETLIQENAVDLLLVDDGFQTRNLHRDLNVVLIDALEPIENYHLVPMGRLREPLQALSRADHLVVTRTNLASASQMEKLRDLLERHAPARARTLVTSELRVSGIAPKAGHEKPVPQRFLLLSGIGRPESFERILDQSSVEWTEHIVHRDHARYSASDVDNWLQRMRHSGAEAILTTEKDVVKLESLPGLADHLWVARIEVTLSSEARSLYEDIERLARH